MGLLRKAIAGLCAALLAIPALAAAPATQGRLGVRQAFHGAGTPGFLSTCSGLFDVQNNIAQSNTFNGSQWGASGVSITSTTTDAPDGTNTATTLSISNPGAGGVSSIYQQLGEYGVFAYTTAIWARNRAPANGTAYLIVTGTTYKIAAVPTDGRWHQISLYRTAQDSGDYPYLEVASDLRDPNEVPPTGTLTIDIWHANSSEGRGPGGGAWPYVVNATSGQVDQTMTLACPTTLAFRDFSKLAPYPVNPIIAQNPAEPYQAGGISFPYLTADGYTLNGKPCGLINATDTVNHNDWFSFGLYCGASAFQMSEVPSVNPVIHIPGSNFNTGATGTGSNMVSYALHPQALPGGCTVSSVKHAYCYVFSANPASTFMAYADNITGPYNFYGGNTNPARIIPNSESGLNGFSLPTVMRVGALNYMYTSVFGNNGNYTTMFTSPVGDGVNWTYQGRGLPPILAASFDNGRENGQNGSALIDPAVVKNRCGYYEFYTTSFFTGTAAKNNVGQSITYQVADDPRGPWYKLNMPVIPYTSSIYSGTPFIGDSVPVFYNRQLILGGNYDDGAGRSGGYVATMPDACA